MSYTALLRKDFGYICKLMKDVDIDGNQYIMECMVPCLISEGNEKILAYQFLMRNSQTKAKKVKGASRKPI